MTREQALAGRARPHILTSRLFSVKAPSMKLLSWQAMTSTRDKRRPQGLLIYSCADEDLGAGPRQNERPKLAHCEWIGFVVGGNKASLAQLVEHALRKCTVHGLEPHRRLLHQALCAPLKTGTSTSADLSTRGRRLLLAASTATYSLLSTSSPWPYANRAHALPAELRRPCSWAM